MIHNETIPFILEEDNFTDGGRNQHAAGDEMFLHFVNNLIRRLAIRIAISGGHQTGVPMDGLVSY